jgi:hypothetical protein
MPVFAADPATSVRAFAIVTASAGRHRVCGAPRVLPATGVSLQKVTAGNQKRTIAADLRAFQVLVGLARDGAYLGVLG